MELTAHARAQSFLPVRPVELLILTMLGTQERHGYGIRQDILEYSNGSVALEAGNLYRHIRRLEDDGLIERSISGDEQDERRQNFRITRLGRDVLKAELSRLRELVQFAELHRLVPVPRS